MNIIFALLLASCLPNSSDSAKVADTGDTPAPETEEVDISFTFSWDDERHYAYWDIYIDPTVEEVFVSEKLDSDEDRFYPDKVSDGHFATVNEFYAWAEGDCTEMFCTKVYGMPSDLKIEGMWSGRLWQCAFGSTSDGSDYYADSRCAELEIE